MSSVKSTQQTTGILHGRGEWATFARLCRWALPHWRRLLIGCAFGLLYAATAGGLLWLVRDGVGRIFEPETSSLRAVVAIAALFPLLGLLRGVADYVSRYLIQWTGNRVVFDLRNALCDQILRLSVLYFSRSRSGDLVSRMANDTMLVQRSVSTVLTALAQQPATLLVCLGYLFLLDPLLAGVSLFLFPVCIIPVLQFGRRVRRDTRESQQKLADLTSIVQEMVGGVRIVKAFGMSEYESDRFMTKNRALLRHVLRVVRARAATEPIIVLIATLGIAAVFVYARWATMPFPHFVSYAMALMMLYEPVKKLSRLHLQIQQSSAAADRVFEVLDTESFVQEAPDAVAVAERIDQITFDRVSFAYDREPVLRELSFSVPAGTRLALVGGSGAGKTTLVNLVPRFFDVTEGRILVNETDIRALRIGSLRERIGIVTQETVLFNDTVANNIAYGRRGASQTEIEGAARRAHAHEFILGMSDGYRTVVGERGIRLSGGQRQRLAIARALLRNPPILILDEATSALDTESERLVQSAIDQLMEGRTVFAIAHRLSTIVNCDRILVLHNGRIVEDGRHEELLAAAGLYKRLYDMQFENGTSDA